MNGGISSGMIPTGGNSWVYWKTIMAATLFGGMHYSAVSKSSARLERDMAHDNALRDLVEQIVSNVNRLLLKAIFSTSYASKK
jgi:hypothetical protein